jgi:hypothetical protein
MTAGLCLPVACPARGAAQLWHPMTRMRLTCEQETFSWHGDGVRRGSPLRP